MWNKLEKLQYMELTTNYKQRVSKGGVYIATVNGKLYFQVDIRSRNYQELTDNPNVVLNKGYTQIKAIAKDVGGWSKNPGISSAYHRKFNGLYQTSTKSQSMTVIELVPTKIKILSYENNKMYRYRWDSGLSQVSKGEQLIKTGEDLKRLMIGNDFTTEEINQIINETKQLIIESVILNLSFYTIDDSLGGFNSEKDDDGWWWSTLIMLNNIQINQMILESIDSNAINHKYLDMLLIEKVLMSNNSMIKKKLMELFESTEYYQQMLVRYLELIINLEQPGLDVLKMSRPEIIYIINYILDNYQFTDGNTNLNWYLENRVSRPRIQKLLKLITEASNFENLNMIFELAENLNLKLGDYDDRIHITMFYGMYA